MHSLQLHKVAVFKLLLAFILLEAVTGDDSLETDERLRVFPEAAVFETEDKAGKGIDYFQYFQEFVEVQELIDNHGLEKISLLCAKGVFILYNWPFYISHADDDVQVFAGVDQCLNPGSMRSLLYIEGYINPKTPTLTIFEDERFTTPYFIINRQDEHDHQAIQTFGVVRSFVLMGKTPWTVSTKKGTYCLKAGLDSEFPVCPVAYSSKVFGDPTTWISAERGCNTTYDSEVKLEYCFNHGSGNLEPSTDGSPPPPSPPPNISGPDRPTKPITESDTENGIFSNCDNHEEFAMLLRIRLTHDFNSLYQVQFPFNKKHAWRTEILDSTFEIVSLSQPEELISREVILFIRELYIYFAEKEAWSKGRGWPSSMPTQRVKRLAYETSRCLMKLKSIGWLEKTAQASLNVLSALEKPQFEEANIEDSFRRLPETDVTMEFVWLAINYVGVACHGALEFESDFWMEYMNIAYNMYLHPMIGFWGNNGIVSQYYPLILGGHNVTRQLEGLAVATTILYHATPINRLTRPDLLYNILAEG